MHQLITNTWKSNNDLRNIWILKPHNRCGGKGITILDDIVAIVANLNKSLSCGCSCIVQKYIETPLLIHNSKFDIRHFLLVMTDENNLWIWAHDLFYIRFSSQRFTLDKLHESIHLTNRSVQKMYTNLPRNVAIPSNNHWSRSNFEAYLANQFGQDNTACSQIVSKMNENMVGVVLSALDNIHFQANRFCLFGVDFLVTRDFDVYLLEVNNHPGLNDPTEVTGSIFKTVMADTIKGENVCFSCKY